MKLDFLLEIAVYLAIIAIVIYLSLNTNHFYQIGGEDSNAPSSTDAPPTPSSTDAPPTPSSTDAPPTPSSTDAPAAPSSTDVPATSDDFFNASKDVRNANWNTVYNNLCNTKDGMQKNYRFCNSIINKLYMRTYSKGINVFDKKYNSQKKYNH